MLANFDKATTGGRRRLETALSAQALLCGLDTSVLKGLADQVMLQEHPAGKAILAQGHISTDVYFIIAGQAEVTIDLRHIGFRNPGDHIGEMSAIEPSAPRSACVEAKSETLTACISADALFELADANPRVWLNLAKVLASRLRARPVRARNERPHVFLGGSTEGLNVTKQLVRQFAYEPFVARPWTVGVFQPSGVTMDDLLREAAASDFAVLSFGPDDKTTSRRKQQPAPRDNVVLEYGLFAGALGDRKRVFIVVPRGVNLKLPSDIYGLKVLDYDTSNPLDVALTPIALEISAAIALQGPR